MIRTARLAAVQDAPGGTATLVYTVPAGQHVRLRRSQLSIGNAVSRVILYAWLGGVTCWYLDVTPATVRAVAHDAGDLVLEAGDQVWVFVVNAAATADVWLSGTVYDE